ncbi:MAG TPA: imidazole glycerol phosphate synthase subunit HisH [Pirellulaceae bacterium]|nr:imidazole glycerol phosphate synthase subunit HisH [Pirellulaceae bacterium]
MHAVGLINYGSGNFTSVRNALRHIGVDPLEIDSPEAMGQADRLILPGVGSFPAAMERMETLGLIDSLRDQVLGRGRPFLGICVGMQILAELGHEFRTCSGLGLVPGQVRRFDVEHLGLPVPHMGWNELRLNRPSPLFERLDPNPSFYFVHSFRFEPTDPESVLASCDYGETFCACVQRDQVYGVQFHPEKSQRDGLALLANFCRLN